MSPSCKTKINHLKFACRKPRLTKNALRECIAARITRQLFKKKEGEEKYIATTTISKTFRNNPQQLRCPAIRSRIDQLQAVSLLSPHHSCWPALSSFAAQLTAVILPRSRQPCSPTLSSDATQLSSRKAQSSAVAWSESQQLRCTALDSFSSAATLRARQQSKARFVRHEEKHYKPIQTNEARKCKQQANII